MACFSFFEGWYGIRLGLPKGFDTKDLLEAKVLLAELERGDMKPCGAERCTVRLKMV